MATVKKVIVAVVYPTGYDKWGFPRRFKNGLFMPSYVLEVIKFLTEQGLSHILSKDIEFEIHAFNLQLAREARAFRKLEESLAERNETVKVILAMVGVMAYQLLFSIDTMRRWKKIGADCFVGGPAVNGGVAEMLEGVPKGSPCSGEIIDELEFIQEQGFTLFAGDAYPQDPEKQSVWEGALRDAIFDKPKSFYNGGWAPLETAPIPPWRKHSGYIIDVISIDQQSGCPYFANGRGCIFCSIGSLSGKETRERSAEQVIRYFKEILIGCPKTVQLFLLGDNGARAQNSISFLNRLIELKKDCKVPLSSLQVDTQVHKIPGFMELCEQANVGWVFVGVETPNVEGLKTLKKIQNNPAEYKDFCDRMWQAEINPIGSIMIGQEHHTPAVIIKEVDVLCEDGFTPLFTILTPSPGSPMNSTLRNKGKIMSLAEFNEADSSGVVADHPLMSRQELQEVYWIAWKRAYAFRYQVYRLRRLKSWSRWIVNLLMLVGFWRVGRERIHPLLSGNGKVFDFWDKKPESIPFSRYELFKLKTGTKIKEIWLNLCTVPYFVFLAVVTAPIFRSFKKM